MYESYESYVLEEESVFSEPLAGFPRMSNGNRGYCNIDTLHTRV